MSRKGIPNKQQGNFRERLEAYAKAKGVEPHFWMVDLLAKKGVRLEVKCRIAQELAQYLHPKLRATEVSGELSHHHLLERIEGMGDAELQVYVAALRAERNGHHVPEP